MTSERIRHAVVRSTGATTWARKVDTEWHVDCLNHGSSAKPTESRAQAWKLASHPQDWCAKCKPIAAGKADKITDGKLDLPAKKAPAKKSTGRKAKA